MSRIYGRSLTEKKMMSLKDVELDIWFKDSAKTEYKKFHGIIYETDTFEESYVYDGMMKKRTRYSFYVVGEEKIFILDYSRFKEIDFIDVYDEVVAI